VPARRQRPPAVVLVQARPRQRARLAVAVRRLQPAPEARAAVPQEHSRLRALVLQAAVLLEQLQSKARLPERRLP
jgi:hypothetical protein